MYAEAAVRMISAYANSIGCWATTVFNGDQLDCFDISETGSHKHIPVDSLDGQLGLPKGAGVYGYVKFADNSYALTLCGGRLAYWTGKDEDPPVAV